MHPILDQSKLNFKKWSISLQRCFRMPLVLFVPWQDRDKRRKIMSVSALTLLSLGVKLVSFTSRLYDELFLQQTEVSSYVRQADFLGPLVEGEFWEKDL